MRILIVDDERLQRLNCRGLLGGHEIVEASSFADAQKKLHDESIDLALLDLDLDVPLAGLELAKTAKKNGIYAVITTGHCENDIIEKAYHFGCQDYLTKPISKNALELVINRFISFESEKRVDDLIHDNYVTYHDPTISELNLIKKINLSTRPILIKGPTGTGKSIVARLIKEACRISDEKFVALNCAQFSDGLLESELFGHKKGAFTGAIADKIGLLQKADGGMIFLDEIHSLSKSAQQKLMKAVEEKVFYPVGSTKQIQSNFRVVCATCEDLLQMVEEKTFRTDFYARISHLQIQLYPLNERREDILPLIEHYHSKYLRKIVITEEARELLKKLEWPHNTRDVESLVDYWNINRFGRIGVEQIPSTLTQRATSSTNARVSKGEVKKIREMGIKRYIETVRAEIVAHFLLTNNANKSATARELGVTDGYLKYALTKGNVNHPFYEDRQEEHENTIQ